MLIKVRPINKVCKNIIHDYKLISYSADYIIQSC